MTSCKKDDPKPSAYVDWVIIEMDTDRLVRSEIDCTATVYGSQDISQEVTWEVTNVDNVNGVSIDSKTGHLTIGDIIDSTTKPTGTITLQATSVFDPTKKSEPFNLIIHSRINHLNITGDTQIIARLDEVRYEYSCEIDAPFGADKTLEWSVINQGEAQADISDKIDNEHITVETGSHLGNIIVRATSVVDPDMVAELPVQIIANPTIKLFGRDWYSIKEPAPAWNQYSVYNSETLELYEEAKLQWSFDPGDSDAEWNEITNSIIIGDTEGIAHLSVSHIDFPGSTQTLTIEITNQEVVPTFTTEPYEYDLIKGVFITGIENPEEFPNYIYIPSELEVDGSNETVLGFKDEALQGLECTTVMFDSEYVDLGGVWEKTGYGGQGLFKNSKAEFIFFPDDLAILPDSICSGSEELKYVHLPTQLKTIKSRAFAECASMLTLYLPLMAPGQARELYSIWNQAFLDGAIENIFYQGTIDNFKFYIRGGSDNLWSEGLQTDTVHCIDGDCPLLHD